MKKSILSILTLLAIPLACASLPVEDARFPSSEIKALHLTSDSGNILIVGTDTKEATVKITKKKWPSHCHLRVDREGSSLKIEAHGSGGGGECRAHLEISLPKAVDMRLSVGLGDITLRSLRGSLDAKVGNGDLVAEKVVLPRVQIKAGNGDSKLEGEFGDVVLKIGNGTMTLTYTSIPRGGELVVKMGNGDCKVTLPAATPVDVVGWKSGFGRLVNEFPPRKGQGYRITGKAGHGDLRVLKRSLISSSSEVSVRKPVGSLPGACRSEWKHLQGGVVGFSIILPPLRKSAHNFSVPPGSHAPEI